MLRTTVVNVNKSPYEVYIGRANKRHGVLQKVLNVFAFLLAGALRTTMDCQRLHAAVMIRAVRNAHHAFSWSP